MSSSLAMHLPSGDHTVRPAASEGDRLQIPHPPPILSNGFLPDEKERLKGAVCAFSDIQEALALQTNAIENVMNRILQSQVREILREELRKVDGSIKQASHDYVTEGRSPSKPLVWESNKSPCSADNSEEQKTLVNARRHMQAFVRTGDLDDDQTGSPWAPIPEDPLENVPSLQTGGENKVSVVAKSYCDLQGKVKIFVQGVYFETATIIAIITNSVVIGIQTDIYASTGLVPGEFALLEIFFCLYFTSELALRIIAYGNSFFKQGWRWNTFDLILVFTQLVDLAFFFFSQDDELNSDIAIVRTMRLLKIFRIGRLLRILRFVASLHWICQSIFDSFTSVFWTALLLMLVLYVLGIYFCGIYTVKGWKGQDSTTHDDLKMYFGSVGTSVLTLFQVVTGGIDWAEISRHLLEVDLPSCIVLCLFIAFVLFALMNNINGVFVETALRTMAKNKDVLLLHHAHELFAKTDANGDGMLTWHEFKNQLHTASMKTYFEAIDLDINEAETLFQLIDADGSGELDSREFVNGCFRLRGAAKAIEFETFLRDFDDLNARVTDVCDLLQKHTAHVEPCLLKLEMYLNSIDPNPSRLISPAEEVAVRKNVKKPTAPLRGVLVHSRSGVSDESGSCRPPSKDPSLH